MVKKSSSLFTLKKKNYSKNRFNRTRGIDIMAILFGARRYSGRKVLLGFKAVQIKGNMGLERYLVISAVEKDYFFCLKMLFYGLHVYCKGISSGAVEKQQRNGATCSNS